jgi:phosphotransferase system HPr (HPr) family protein
MNEQYEADIVVASRPGIDAAAAARVVRAASRFDSEITVHYHGAMANAKSILGLLALCVREGEAIRVVAAGSDATAALEALERVFSLTDGGPATRSLSEWRANGSPQRPGEPRPAAV